MSMRRRNHGVVLLLAAALGASQLACEYLFPTTPDEKCEAHCARLVECELEDSAGQASCQSACVADLEAGREPAELDCSGRVTCDGVVACIECLPYCDKFVSCEFGSQGSCASSCEADHMASRQALGEACVLQESCDEGSLCILCDQYCRKLEECNLSTEPACASSCVTVLQAGADETPYQCVVASACSEVPNCGI